jgi:hypothetical protein
VRSREREAISLCAESLYSPSELNGPVYRLPATAVPATSSTPGVARAWTRRSRCRIPDLPSGVMQRGWSTESGSGVPDTACGRRIRVADEGGAELCRFGVGFEQRDAMAEPNRARQVPRPLCLGLERLDARDGKRSGDPALLVFGQLLPARTSRRLGQRIDGDLSTCQRNIRMKPDTANPPRRIPSRCIRSGVRCPVQLVNGSGCIRALCGCACFPGANAARLHLPHQPGIVKAKPGVPGAGHLVTVEYPATFTGFVRGVSRCGSPCWSACAARRRGVHFRSKAPATRRSHHRCK